MALNSTQIKEIAFSEQKSEKKKLTTETQDKMLFWQNFNKNRPVKGKSLRLRNQKRVNIEDWQYLPSSWIHY